MVVVFALLFDSGPTILSLSGAQLGTIPGCNLYPSLRQLGGFVVPPMLTVTCIVTVSESGTVDRVMQ
jgi:hypothetical protein